jgi:hypothetical protein
MKKVKFIIRRFVNTKPELLLSLMGILLVFVFLSILFLI